MNQFLTKRYEDIMLMSKKICKGSVESEDVAHFAIQCFMEHERGQELVDTNRAMNFLSGIIWRSFNSSTSEYHRIYRQKNRMHQIVSEQQIEQIDIPYDVEKDVVIGAIQGIIEDMAADKTELWYRATLFNMWLETPNYSELAKRTKIPRNSISHAVEEAKQYIREQLKQRNITYEF